MSRRSRRDLVEVSETQRIARSLRRLYRTTPFDADRWRRALYHSLGMSGAPTREERTKIREALGLA